MEGSRRSWGRGGLAAVPDLPLRDVEAVLQDVAEHAEGVVVPGAEEEVELQEPLRIRPKLGSRKAPGAQH